MEQNYTHKESTHPMTGDPMWMVEDISLALGGVSSLVEKFIASHKHDDYTLSIFDTATGNTIEIDCPQGEMPQIAEYIYQLAKGTPLTFVGVNSMSDSYVVGMTITRGRIEFGSYKAEDGKLKKI